MYDFMPSLSARLRWGFVGVSLIAGVLLVATTVANGASSREHGPVHKSGTWSDGGDDVGGYEEEGVDVPAGPDTTPRPHPTLAAQRSDRNDARISSEKIRGCSQAAKCPPLSALLKWIRLGKARRTQLSGAA